MRILLVEDQALAAEALQLLLEEDGHEVTLAATYQTAVNLIDAADGAACNCYDVALLDLKLPDGDGRHLVARVKRSCPSTRVYLATGSAVLMNDSDGLRFEDTSELARELGADGCLGKPVDYEQLIDLIQN